MGQYFHRFGIEPDVLLQAVMKGTEAMRANSSNQTNEVLFELCDQIILIVELNKLGVNGLFNTIQYFTDVEVDSKKIKHV